MQYRSMLNVFTFTWAIQGLRNAVGVGWVSAFPENSVTKVYGSTLLALRGGGGGGVTFPKQYRPQNA